MKDTIANRFKVLGNILILLSSCFLIGGTFHIKGLEGNSWAQNFLFVIFFMTFIKLGSLLDDEVFETSKVDLQIREMEQ